jgi:hypothetical protein
MKPEVLDGSALPILFLFLYRVFSHGYRFLKIGLCFGIEFEFQDFFGTVLFENAPGRRLKHLVRMPVLRFFCGVGLCFWFVWAVDDHVFGI